MAGSRPSSFKAGGGFLNNVDGSIADYEFTPDFPGSEGKRNSKSDFNPLYFVLTADVDGSEKPQQTTMLAGSADDFEIEDGGKTLTPVDDKVGLRQNTPFARFLSSLVVDPGGFPESSLPDDGEPINYEAILGWRVRFVQVPDEIGMEKAAKTWRKSNGKFNEQGQKKGKDGKYYNLTELRIAEVYGPPEETVKGKSAKGKTVAATTTKTTKSTGKANGKVEVDLDELAAETLLAILADNDGEIAKSKLPQQIAKKLGVKHPHREEVRKLIYSDDFLTTENGWTYDQSSKNQLIATA